MPSEDVVLQVRDLCIDAVDGRGKSSPIVEHIGFSLQAGQVIALIGESGSGKTTAALATLGYARPGCRIRQGSVLLQGENLLELDAAQLRALRGRDIAYVAQSAAAAFNGALTIGKQVTETAVVKGLMTQQQADRRALELYRQLGLPDPESIGKRYPHQLSGGQLQRLMAAMAMMCQPKLLILDEPTTALDVTTQIEVLKAFKQLIRDQQVSTIYISHDLAVVAQIADQILVMKQGRMVELQTTAQLLQAPTQDYTRELILAVPRLTKGPRDKRPGPAAEDLLTVSNITASYGSNGSTTLKNVSVTVRQGETLALIGESGSGKTTLGRVISGLMPPQSGRIALQGRTLPSDCQKRSRQDLKQIQFVFQSAQTALNPHHRIRHILGRPLEFYLGLTGRDARQRIAELLKLVELPDEFIDRYPRELSGGQLQRINFARALAAEPKLIICDEITSALDTLVAKSIIDLLLGLKQRLGISYIFISHDLSTVSRLADFIAVMRDGEIVDCDRTEIVLQPPHHEYTRLLLNSIPRLRPGWLEQAAIEPPRREMVAAPQAEFA